MKIFLDMDGVLADFVGGACKAHNRTCYDHPSHYGEFQLEKIWGITPAEFWKPTNSFEFWASLAKTPEADMIVETAVKLVGWENIAILTSPSLHESCVPAKRYWIEKYYPRLTKNMIFAWGKGFIAGPGKLLVDDRDRNVDDFRAAGGQAVLVPRLWNRRYNDVITREFNLQEELKSYVQPSSCVSEHS